MLPFRHLPLVMPGMRIGLLGGSFNPPHEGHVHLSQEALKRLDLHQVWWLVTPGNPLKNNNHLPSLETRMNLCRKLVHDPRIKVTGFEAHLLRAPATSTQTIAYLTQRFDQAHFVWLMGADNLAQFSQWYQWQQIAQQIPIAVFDRPSYRARALNSQAARWLARYRLPESAARNLAILRPPAFTFIHMPRIGLSSTKIREDTFAGIDEIFS